MLGSPLEQFEVLPLFSLFGSSSIFLVTNVNVFLLLVLGVLIVFFRLALYNSTIYPSNYQAVAETVYTFVYSFAEESLGKIAKHYFPFLFTVFLFVLGSNFLGLIPYSFTVTSQLVVTFCVGFSAFFGLNFIGLRKHGLHFFSLFLPKGAPLALAPFLVLIELISYVFRVFSLSIRLFANMFAGHTLLNILSGFSFMLAPPLCGGNIFSVLPWLSALLPLLIVFAVMILESGIAFLQAYVFTVLLCLYLNDALNLH